MFNKTWIKHLPDNPFMAVKFVAQKVIDADANKNDVKRLDNYNSYIDLLAFLKQYSDQHNLLLKLPSLFDNKLKNINIIVDFCYRLRESINKNITKIIYDNSMSKYKKYYGDEMEDELNNKQNDSDIVKVQRIVNELRFILVNSEDFEDYHKKKLLIKLEKLQLELHTELPLSERIIGKFAEIF